MDFTTPKKTVTLSSTSQNEDSTGNSDFNSPKHPIHSHKVLFPPRFSLKPLKVSSPFGPKAKACIIPFKDLSAVSQIELDDLEFYHFWSDIGKGSYAKVKLATHKQTGLKYAVKIYTKKDLEDPTLRQNVTREIKILKKIESPHIVKFKEEINGKKNLYLVMEYVKGISLNTHVTQKAMKRLQEDEACDIFTQIISALDYCHSRNIVHRDIKLENVLLDLNFNVKLIDFGFATCFSNSKKSLIFCGSPTYMAPEIISKQEFFGPPVDVWAAGVLLFVLVTGGFPFNSKTESRIFQKILEGKFEVPETVSRNCRDLILKMLDPVAENRITSKGILSDIWVKTRGGSSSYGVPNPGDNIEVLDGESIS